MCGTCKNKTSEYVSFAKTLVYEKLTLFEDQHMISDQIPNTKTQQIAHDNISPDSKHYHISITHIYISEKKHYLSI